MSALDILESARDLRVLFVGDIIVDEYQYVSPLGKSPKEYLMPVRYDRKEVFQGGVVAAANHARPFCKEVTVYSRGPITRKLRYVDPTYMRKLWEVHYDEGMAELGTFSTDFDITVVTDFGHGAVTPQLIEQLEQHTRFLAVNAQTNSANTGYNLITKYARADYIVIDEPEARLAARNRDGRLEDVIDYLAAHCDCQKMIVTLGYEGAMGYEDGSYSYADAMTKKVVDTMGAGDAFFAVTALFAKHGSIEDLLAIGNAAGAAKTQIIGHREAISRDLLLDFL